jgi:hypothetical protein
MQHTGKERILELSFQVDSYFSNFISDKNHSSLAEAQA